MSTMPRFSVQSFVSEDMQSILDQTLEIQGREIEVIKLEGKRLNKALTDSLRNGDSILARIFTVEGQFLKDLGSVEEKVMIHHARQRAMLKKASEKSANIVGRIQYLIAQSTAIHQRNSESPDPANFGIRKIGKQALFHNHSLPLTEHLIAGMLHVWRLEVEAGTLLSHALEETNTHLTTHLNVFETHVADASSIRNAFTGQITTVEDDGAADEEDNWEIFSRASLHQASYPANYRSLMNAESLTVYSTGSKKRHTEQADTAQSVNSGSLDVQEEDAWRYLENFLQDRTSDLACVRGTIQQHHAQVDQQDAILTRVGNEVEEQFSEIEIRLGGLRNHFKSISSPLAFHPSDTVTDSIRERINLTIILDKLWVIGANLVALQQYSSSGPSRGQQLAVLYQELDHAIWHLLHSLETVAKRGSSLFVVGSEVSDETQTLAAMPVHNHESNITKQDPLSQQVSMELQDDNIRDSIVTSSNRMDRKQK
ncbi:hypothetical protein FB446DRAFT_707283 [Lentinula raphanica]|nr:hypothetical protein FB446DRAFT_707283 [Lentinula raphanica]